MVKALNIKAPDYCTSEQQYIFDVLLGDFLGLEFVVEYEQRDSIVISEYGSATRQPALTLNTDFFKNANVNWLGKNSMPDNRKVNIDLSRSPLNSGHYPPCIPVLFGTPEIFSRDSGLHIAFDLFGTAFFLLSRYEEAILLNRDSHNRFPSTASTASKHGFLDRPLVNEYLEVLWTCLKQLFPKLVRSKRTFRNIVSCDVDHPIDQAARSLLLTGRRIAARLIRDRNPSLAVLDALNYFASKMGSVKFDCYHQNIYWMMSLAEQHGHKLCFNFIPTRTHEGRDANNHIQDAVIRKVINDITIRGHEIGIHPGYDSFNNPTIFGLSADAFHSVMQLCNVRQSSFGGRQHYLRYDVLATPQLWSVNGLAYDSTLGFADHSGFRSSVCYEYNAYDLKQRSSLILKNRPLIVMDCSIVEANYEGLGLSEKAYRRILTLRDTCQLYNGDFTLLWHNSYLFTTKHVRFYEDLMRDL